jgi:hypothetical protein
MLSLLLRVLELLKPDLILGSKMLEEEIRNIGVNVGAYNRDFLIKTIIGSTKKATKLCGGERETDTRAHPPGMLYTAGGGFCWRRLWYSSHRSFS